MRMEGAAGERPIPEAQAGPHDGARVRSAEQLRHRRGNHHRHLRQHARPRRRGGAVVDGKTGAVLNRAGAGGVILDSDPVLGDLDHDGTVELVANQVFGWDAAGKTWKVKYPGFGATDPKQAAAFYAFADFGTR